MKRLLPLLALLFTACGNTPHKPAAEAHAAGQVIVLTDSMLTAGGTDTIRFGRLYSGEIAEKRFRLRNDASRPVVILTYRRSCGCTILEYENRPVPPGEELPATLRFDSQGEHGWQLRTVDVVLSGAEKPLRIFVEADVE